MENNNTDKFYNIESVVSSLQYEFDLELDIFTIKELGAKILKDIGNIYQSIYLYVGEVVDGELDVPCNATSIISVTNNCIIDYTGLPRRYDSDIYDLQQLPEVKRIGEYVNYRYENGKLYFYANVVDADKPNMTGTCYVLYASQLVDETGYPKITWYEKEAIASFCYYIELRKKATLGLMNANMLSLYQKDYVQKVQQSRLPLKLTKNLMDKVLDIKLGYGLKNYGKSF